jgi:multicomponent Na+:H+ antiporter subunit G
VALALDIASWACLVGGSIFALIGAIGIVRLPDVYSRMHGAGMIDTLGAALILLGLMLQSGHWLVTVKLILIGVFLFFTSPTTTFALARAGLNAGVKPLVGAAAADGRCGRSEGDGPSSS